MGPRTTQYIFILFLLLNITYYLPLPEGMAPEDFSIRIRNLTFYLTDIPFIIAGLIVLPGIVPSIRNEKNPSNRMVLTACLVYLLFQTLIMVPMSFFQGIRIPTIFRGFAGRLYYLELFFFYFIVLRFTRTEKIAAFVNWSVALLAMVAVVDLVSGRVTELPSGEMRMFWGGAALIFGFSVIFNFHTKRLTFLKGLLLAFGFFGLLIINHRSAYIAVVFSLLFGLFVSRYRAKYARFMLLAVCLMVFFFSFSSSRIAADVVSRVDLIINPQDANTMDRIMRWKCSLEYFQTQWLFGSGLSGKYYLVDFNDYFKGILNANYAPHNFIIEVLATEGVVGFLFLTGIYGAVLRVGMRNSRRDSHSLALTTYLLFYLGFCFFNTNFNHARSVMFQMLALALILARNRYIHEETIVNQTLHSDPRAQQAGTYHGMPVVPLTTDR